VAPDQSQCLFLTKIVLGLDSHLVSAILPVRLKSTLTIEE